MNNKQEQSKVLSKIDIICISIYLISGFGMLYYADSIEKIIVGGAILIMSLIMIYIVYIKEKHLTLEKRL